MAYINSRIAIVLTILVAQGLVCCFGADKTSLSGVRTNFIPEAVLPERDLKTVVKLAQDCGVTEVAEVFTFKIDSSSYCGIGVKGVETKDGRQLSSVNALVCSKKWGSQRSKRARDVIKSSGSFWIERGDVCTNVVTTFMVPSGTVRVQLADSVSLETADKIVDAFAKGHIKYGESLRRKDDLKGVDFSRPVSLEAKGDAFAACYSPLPWVSVYVYFTLDPDGITIVGVDKLAS